MGRVNKNDVVAIEWDTYVKESHRSLVSKYVSELRKQVKPGELVHQSGYVLNFIKEAGGKIEEGQFEESGQVQFLEVSV